VLSQENKGPGAARNAGLHISTGKYVWFVDSDDDIHLEAINFLKSVEAEDFDFIDFNHDSPHGVVNSMDLLPGIYDDQAMLRTMLLKKFGRICTKVINRKIIIENRIYYPEYCIYEDNPLAFIYPFHIRRFLKSNIVAYVHYEEFASVTRSNPSPRYFDRMYTAAFGLVAGLGLTSEQTDKDHLYEKFINLYLINTAGRFMGKLPTSDWIIATRIMRRYREVAKQMGIKRAPLSRSNRSRKYKMLFTFLWFWSYFLGDQESYFKKIRHLAWGRDFNAAT
jgi:glycosyltransferase involved in cell wall biosynthesis